MTRHMVEDWMDEFPCRTLDDGSVLHSMTCSLSDTPDKPGARCANLERADVEAADRMAREPISQGLVVEVDEGLVRYRLVVEDGGPRVDVSRLWRGVESYVGRYDLRTLVPLCSGVVRVDDQVLRQLLGRLQLPDERRGLSHDGGS